MSDNDIDHEKYESKYSSQERPGLPGSPGPADSPAQDRSSKHGQEVKGAKRRGGEA